MSPVNLLVTSHTISLLAIYSPFAVSNLPNTDRQPDYAGITILQLLVIDLIEITFRD